MDEPRVETALPTPANADPGAPERRRRELTPEYAQFLRDIGASDDLVSFVDSQIRSSTTGRRRRGRLSRLLFRRRA